LFTHNAPQSPSSIILYRSNGGDALRLGWLIGWLEFSVPFQHIYGYIRDEYGWEGNRWSGVVLAMRCRLQSFIRL